MGKLASPVSRAAPMRNTFLPGPVSAAAFSIAITLGLGSGAGSPPGIPGPQIVCVCVHVWYPGQLHSMHGAHCCLTDLYISFAVGLHL